MSNCPEAEIDIPQWQNKQILTNDVHKVKQTIIHEPMEKYILRFVNCIRNIILYNEKSDCSQSERLSEKSCLNQQEKKRRYSLYVEQSYIPNTSKTIVVYLLLLWYQLSFT